ncbi:MAG: DUF1266 domain-containing protein [Corynebacterium sp.]|uniref:DUF1266 domain-containing protein n=1 Tax=Corynebacterium TaxID=1716 RepID=UPI002648E113|nr:DUF1266 domain-containing protein [Corynebacterium sp.]MDN5721781.1 DUF1266 domain-containing protein [Corynebacterium sp.]MDN6281346.1 DUF1266 domain-containing protein [Corynebacterium sp.]MDN6304822.1 DUF1266 domain-containing protein [Corynebacterium sp.]MDN6353522.1 DUF1266 domain-containing protein [Corynebacterium sp.]MDN6366670.1 DUF1266 domain-containing protein [Corynebacterium sp.]
MSLPYELGPDRIIDGPGPAPQPKKGLKKLIGGGDEGRCRQMLSGSWEVTNREEALNTAHELLTYAGDAGYRALRPALTDLVQLPVPQRGQHLVGLIAATREAVDPEVPDEAVAAEVRRVAGPFLLEESVRALPSQLPTDTVGWDSARALRMLWMAHGAGYITEEDAEPLVRGALEVTRQVYSSWREHADGFIVGRTQWTGMIDEGSFEYVGGMAISLNHPESPWATTPLK